MKEGGAVFWNHDNGRFDLNESEYVLGEAFYKLMKEITKSLGEGFVMSDIRSFEVRPVFVVKT